MVLEVISLNKPIPSKGAYKPRKNRSKNDLTYEKDLFEALEHLLICAYRRKTIEIKHQTNRDTRRKTHQNLVIQNTSVIDLMHDFLSKKYPSDIYCVPLELKFFRKCYKDYGGSITFATLYSSFKSLDTKTFQKRFSNITFKKLALAIQARLGTKLTEHMLIDDYNTIRVFLSSY